MTDAQDALRRRFRDIGLERLRVLNQAVLALEQGDAPAGAADEAMREIHTLKGESRMLGLGALNVVAHRTEDLLLLARREGRLQDETWLQPVYAGFDLLAELLGEIGDSAPDEKDPRARAFAERAEALLAEAGAAPRQRPSAPSAAGDVGPTKSADPEPDRPAPPEARSSETARDAQTDAGATQRVPRATIDEITRTAGEIDVLQAHLRQFAEDATAVLYRLREERKDGAADEAGLRRLDDLLRAMRDVGFDASLRQQRLRAAVERMRLAPVTTLFGRFPRTVRDLARELGKEARLVIEGSEVGADQQVLDLLADPLVHLLRNAVDHGLEPPDAREAEGKPRRGTVRLRARHAGRFVEIVVGDDGRGIDAAAVAESAIEKGLLSEADVARMSEHELLDQLFRPAFSTRRAVSDVSGRGVGLDVVKSAIEDLGGSVRIESRLGRGTDFVLRLPVSIALVDAVVLDLGRALYAVPAPYVQSILELDAARIERVGGREIVRLEGGPAAPLLDLAQALGLPSGRGDAAAGSERLVVVAEGRRRAAFRVPAVIGELSLVQEALDPFLKALRIVTGTAMLDGGRRVVLLGGVQLMDLVLDTAGPPTPPTPEPDASLPAKRRTALLVEDSDLTRSMLATSLGDAGWRVIEAENGRIGLERFAAEPPDVVLTDLEMPEVDGLEVLARIRGGEKDADVPIVVLTTVADDATKRRAAEAGADVYLVKSAFEAEALLETLDRLVSSRESR